MAVGFCFREATHLIGKSATETDSYLRAESNNHSFRVAAIGLAGENSVRFATISNDGRHAGRGGVGAVMGAKRLKAIAIRGDMDTADRRFGRRRRARAGYATQEHRDGNI